MCSRGVFQLQKLSLFFCDFGGSSAGVRELLTSQKLKSFTESNPHIKLQFICKRNHHPHVKGVYVNGYQKQVPLRSYNENEALLALQSLKNQLGRNSFKASGSRIFGSRKSIQGKWEPNLFNRYPLAELSKTYKIPDIPEGEYKVEDPQRNVRKQDKGVKMMKVRPYIDPHYQVS